MTDRIGSGSGPDGWTENRKYVTRSIEELKGHCTANCGALQEHIAELRVEVANLKVRVAIIGGAIATAISAFFKLLS